MHQNEYWTKQWSLNKMDNVKQTIFSNTVFALKNISTFHRNVTAIYSYGFSMQQYRSVCWYTGGTNVDPVHWSMYVSPCWPHFYQTSSAWSMDQGSNNNHSPVKNVAPTVTKFCVIWEGQPLPHDTKFGNSRDKIVDSRAFLSWSLIHGSSWSGLIKLGPGNNHLWQSVAEQQLKNNVICTTRVFKRDWVSFIADTKLFVVIHLLPFTQWKCHELLMEWRIPWTLKTKAFHKYTSKN